VDLGSFSNDEFVSGATSNRKNAQRQHSTLQPSNISNCKQQLTDSTALF